MSNFQFSPSLMTVTAGQTVTWRNTDTIDHTVTSGANGQASGLFDQRLSPGATFQFTFNQAGTYPYFCKFHVSMGMAATVSVQAAGTSGSSGSTGSTGTTTTGTSATTTGGNTGGYTTGY